MAILTLAALILDVILVVVAFEAFRQRLVTLTLPRATQPEFPLMRPRPQPNEYPFISGMGFLVIWTDEHREYGDRRLTRYAWVARAAMLALPIIFIVQSLLVTARP